MRTLAILMLLVLSASVSQASEGSSGAAGVVDAFHKALAKGDRKAAQDLLDADVKIFEQGSAERSREEYASHHLASDMAFSAATKRVQTARADLELGDLAYVTTESSISGTFKGRAVDSATLETMVLRRSPNGWRIVHIHWSSR